jgi:glyceraldehyde 3-phosphate dehydrogenase
MKTFGINGFGRIGRTAFRVWWQKHREELDLKVINTSGSMDIADWVHLLKYDSNYGHFEHSMSYHQYQTRKEVTDENPLLGTIVLGAQEIIVTAQRDPAKIPWGHYGVHTVIESTGAFTSQDKAALHFQGGAQQVIISAPPKGSGIATSVIGVNTQETASVPTPSTSSAPTSAQPSLNDLVNRIRQKRSLNQTTVMTGVTLAVSPESAPTPSASIISNASCTTNCVAPVLQIMQEKFGVRKAMLTTIHSYTDDQNLHDNSHKDLRRARAAAQNIVPTSTGAAISATEVVPQLKELFDGLAIRVPTAVGSLSDMVFVMERPVTKEEVNHAFIEASQEPRWQGIVAVTDEALVSSDIVGRSESSIVDLSLTNVVGGDLVKVVSWYDNEWGYCNRLVEQVARV